MEGREKERWVGYPTGAVGRLQAGVSPERRRTRQAVAAPAGAPARVKVDPVVELLQVGVPAERWAVRTVSSGMREACSAWKQAGFTPPSPHPCRPCARARDHLSALMCTLSAPRVLKVS